LASNNNPIETGVVGLVPKGTNAAFSTTDLITKTLQLGLKRLVNTINKILEEVMTPSLIVPG
jgi:hypothetical protein